MYTKVLPGQLGLLDLRPEMPETEASIFLEAGEEQHRYNVRITPIGTTQHISGQLIILHDDTNA